MGRDLVSTTVGAAIYSLALGIGSVALPLLALEAGYSAAEVGVLTSVSAISQVLSRLGLGAVMRYLPDWTLITGSGLLLAIGSLVVAWSAAVVPFVVAQLLLGISRACFWTGTQTHVVRGEGRAAGPLALVNFSGGVGHLVGPVLAGVLSEWGPALALAVAAAIALVGVAPTLLLDRLPTFVPPEDRPSGRMWRRPGVNAGCWAGVTVGGWRGLLGSYVPVALDAAGQSALAIGVLVTIANAAALVGSGVAGRIPRGRTAVAVLVGMVMAGLTTGLTAVTASDVFLSAAVLSISGLAAGILQVLGVAMAAEAVHPEERGEVIALAGTFRAAALFAAPLAVAGLVLAVPLAPAVAAVGVAMALPVVGLRRRASTRV